MRLLSAILAMFVMVAPFAAMAADSGDVKKGKKVFRKCRACHMADKPKNGVGPHLVGIIGRKAATVEGYAYSPAMTAKGAEDLMWTEENIVMFSTKPKEFIPGTKMGFAGLKKEGDRVNLIAYLKSLAVPAAE